MDATTTAAPLPSPSAATGLSSRRLTRLRLPLSPGLSVRLLHTKPTSSCREVYGQDRHDCRVHTSLNSKACQWLRPAATPSTPSTVGTAAAHRVLLRCLKVTWVRVGRSSLQVHTLTLTLSRTCTCTGLKSGLNAILGLGGLGCKLLLAATVTRPSPER